MSASLLPFLSFLLLFTHNNNTLFLYLGTTVYCSDRPSWGVSPWNLGKLRDNVTVHMDFIILEKNINTEMAPTTRYRSHPAAALAAAAGSAHVRRGMGMNGGGGGGNVDESMHIAPGGGGVGAGSGMSDSPSLLHFLGN